MSHAHKRAPKSANAPNQVESSGTVAPVMADAALEAAMADFEVKFAAFCAALDHLQRHQLEKAQRIEVTVQAAADMDHAVPLPPAADCESVEPPSADMTPSEVECDDDEALLSQLDKETANAIRVRRRLTRRSVKELLAERQPMQGELAASSSKQTKRAWWRFCL